MAWLTMLNFDSHAWPAAPWAIARNTAFRLTQAPWAIAHTASRLTQAFWLTQDLITAAWLGHSLMAQNASFYMQPNGLLTASHGYAKLGTAAWLSSIYSHTWLHCSLSLADSAAEQP